MSPREGDTGSRVALLSQKERERDACQQARVHTQATRGSPYNIPVPQRRPPKRISECVFTGLSLAFLTSCPTFMEHLPGAGHWARGMKYGSPSFWWGRWTGSRWNEGRAPNPGVGAPRGFPGQSLSEPSSQEAVQGGEKASGCVPRLGMST